MPTFRAALAALVLSIPLALPATAQEGGNTEEVQRALAAGWKATFTCSGLFVAGQTLQELDQNELAGIYPDYVRDYDQLPPATVNQARKIVSVDYSPLMPPRMAAYRPGYGCTQLPIGATEKAIDFLPRFAAWPEFKGQDRGSAIGSNVKVELRLEEAQRLEMPVASAFDEMTYGSGTRTSSVVIVRDGQVVAERYARGVEHETPQRTWSVAKSISATIIGAARRQGLIDIDYPAVISAWNKGADPRREITIRNLLHMASGLDSGESGSRTDRLYFGGGRVVDQAAGNVLEAEPGSRFKYANNDTVIAMRALREAMADDALYHRFPYEAVLHKIGAVRTTLEIDWNGDFISSSQVWATGRDLARIGQLYLQDGMWGTERLLPEDWVEFVRTPAPAQPADALTQGAGYGAQFWLMNNVAGVPPGTFYAAGNRGQYIVIMPTLNTVVVRQGFDTIGGARFDIDRFVLDVSRAIQAADQDRASGDLDLRRAAEAENVR
ncbi:beta-lactamase [Hyphomonas neptunium ATCC 15444]|uniref:Beta-lactamase n=2 Tax=Hyphomonas TaxID=85 RepID=Q0C4L3_HYPNA|nr:MULTISPECIES: serine hydrolase [Hyphomonas]ABI76418.1 beta-lactamase [Hyphomonas neptunium ATCC 15444]KCZ96459.1 beta-lactamase [Hyphomonas hirschiana VP5]